MFVFPLPNLITGRKESVVITHVEKCPTGRKSVWECLGIDLAFFPLTALLGHMHFTVILATAEVCNCTVGSKMGRHVHVCLALMPTINSQRCLIPELYISLKWPRRAGG